MEVYIYTYSSSFFYYVEVYIYTYSSSFSTTCMWRYIYIYTYSSRFSTMWRYIYIHTLVVFFPTLQLASTFLLGLIKMFGRQPIALVAP